MDTLDTGLSKYVSANFIMRETKFPKPFAKAPLYESFIRSQVKSESSNVESSRQTKYRRASVPYFSTTSLGLMTFPRDLDIFCPPELMNPLIIILWELGSSADISMACHIA